MDMVAAVKVQTYCDQLELEHNWIRRRVMNDQGVWIDGDRKCTRCGFVENIQGES